MFSRHISKNVKNIQLKIYELQDIYKFKFEIEVNIDKIIVKIYLDKSLDKYILETIEYSIRKKNYNIWNYYFIDFDKKMVRIYFNSVS